MGHLSTLLSYDEWVNRVFDVITYPLSHINHVMGVSARSTDVNTCPCSVWLTAYMMRVHHCSVHKVDSYTTTVHPWWRHQMETFSALLAICAGNSPVHGEAGDLRRHRTHYDVDVMNDGNLQQNTIQIGLQCVPQIRTRFCYSLFCCGYIINSWGPFY